MRSVWSAAHSTNRPVFYTYRRLSRCSSAGFMLLLAAALTSCDAHLPLQPNGGDVSPGPQAVTSASGGGSQLVGTYTAPTDWAVPGTVTTYQPLTPTGITLAPNRYFLLRVGGIMQVEANPYRAHAVPGNVLHSYSAYESSLSTGRGFTRLTIADGSRTSGMLLSGFGVDEGGEDMILLVRAGPQGSNLLAERGRMPGYDLKWGYCPFTPYCPSDEIVDQDTVFRLPITIEDYWISVPHVVSATEIFEPLTLDASPLVPGTPMTVEALPFDGLRIRTRHGSPAPIRWLWYPGDTASTPNPYISGHTPPGCSDKMVCEFTPTKPGRMVVSTTLEGADVRVSQVLTVQESTLELTCPASVTRGQNMTCTVAAKPNGTLTEVRWIFRDTVGYEVLSPPDLVSWNGDMVIGGEMRVSALLNGDSVSASQSIAVRPRSWSRLRIRVREENPNHLPPPADVSSPGGLADIHADSMGPLPVRTIETGPNTGWSYLHSELPRVPITVHINEPAFAPGSDWRKLQTGGAYTHPDGTVVPNGYCTSGHVPTIRQLAREHEGSSSSALTSHAEVFQRYLQHNPVHEVMEKRIVHRSELQSAVEQWFYGSYVANVAAPLENDPNQAHKSHSPPGLVDLAPFPCYARPWY